MLCCKLVKKSVPYIYATKSECAYPPDVEYTRTEPFIVRITSDILEPDARTYNSKSTGNSDIKSFVFICSSNVPITMPRPIPPISKFIRPFDSMSPSIAAVISPDAKTTLLSIRSFPPRTRALTFNLSNDKLR